MLTLALTTSTGVMGVALADDDVVLGQRSEPTDRRHAERLIPLVQELLADCDRRLGHVERLAVDVGPGLFTGLRVGLATVGGLSRALEVPVVTAPSLFLVAAGAGVEGEVVAVIDARRGEVFRQRFTVTGRRVEPADEAALVDPRAPGALAAGVAVGDGAVRYHQQFEAAGAAVRPGDPSAAELARRAGELSVSPTRVPTACYLREPDARIGVWATRAS